MFVGNYQPFSAEAGRSTKFVQWYGLLWKLVYEQLYARSRISGEYLGDETTSKAEAPITLSATTMYSLVHKFSITKASTKSPLPSFPRQCRHNSLVRLLARSSQVALEFESRLAIKHKSCPPQVLIQDRFPFALGDKGVPCEQPDRPPISLRTLCHLGSLSLLCIVMYIELGSAIGDSASPYICHSFRSLLETK